jgi:hypothetical protein
LALLSTCNLWIHLLGPLSLLSSTPDPDGGGGGVGSLSVWLVSASDLLSEANEDSSDEESFVIELFDIDLSDCDKELIANDGIRTNIKITSIIIKFSLTILIIISFIICNL